MTFSTLRFALGCALASTVTASAVVATSATPPAGHLPAAVFTRDIGGKHAVGYFVPKSGACSVTVMIADRTDPDTALPGPASRLRFTIAAGASATVESGDGAGLALGCSDGAATLHVRGTGSAA